MAGRLPSLIVAGSLFATACTAGGPDTASDEAPSDGSTPVSEATSTTIENYPDAQTRALAARARERRPVENSALPPRHLDPERWPEILVDRNLIVSGGPPPDGIPSIDEPTFVPAGDVDWLDPGEPVAVVTVGDETRIYPIQILIWHEIVNDEVGGEPVTVTYCPLCNSVVAYNRVVDGPGAEPTVLDFGTSGALYQSALVMYDRQTESLWTHFDGRAVVGDLIGAELDLVPAAILGWADAIAANPEAAVLDRPTGDDARPYGEAPYPNYENAPPSAGYVRGAVDPRLPEKQRVVGLNLNGERVAIDRSTVERERAVAIEVDGRALVALWSPGTTSALDGELVADGVDVGAVGVYSARVDGRVLTFERATDDIVDTETGSTWSVAGVAVDGPLAGTRLDPVVHLDTFWFAWVRYHPDTIVAG